MKSLQQSPLYLTNGVIYKAKSFQNVLNLDKLRHGHNKLEENKSKLTPITKILINSASMQRNKRSPDLETIKEKYGNTRDQAEGAIEAGKMKTEEMKPDIDGTKEKVETKKQQAKDVMMGSVAVGMSKAEDMKEKTNNIPSTGIPQIPGRKKRSQDNEAIETMKMGHDIVKETVSSFADGGIGIVSKVVIVAQAAKDKVKEVYDEGQKKIEEIIKVKK